MSLDEILSFEVGSKFIEEHGAGLYILKCLKKPYIKNDKVIIEARVISTTNLSKLGTEVKYKIDTKDKYVSYLSKTIMYNWGDYQRGQGT